MTVFRTLWRVGVDLVIGDDPKIAVAVVMALAAAAALLVAAEAPTAVVTVGGALLIGGSFALSLHLDTRHLKGPGA